MDESYGQLVIDRTEGDEWGFLNVDDRIRLNCFDLLCLDDVGYSLPDYEAHISAFDENEVRHLPNPIKEEGQWCSYVPSHFKVVNPEHWEEMKSCLILCVKCEPLEHLRVKYGFTPLMYDSHEFHITIGVSPNETSEDVESVVRLFNEHLTTAFSSIFSL